MRNAFDAVPREIEEARPCRRLFATTSTMLRRRDAAARSGLVSSPRCLPMLARVSSPPWCYRPCWSNSLPVMMTALQSGRFGAIDWGAVQAGVTVMMVPCLILFLALQRFYIRGLMAGAVK